MSFGSDRLSVQILYIDSHDYMFELMKMEQQIDMTLAAFNYYLETRKQVEKLGMEAEEEAQKGNYDLARELLKKAEISEFNIQVDIIVLEDELVKLEKARNGLPYTPTIQEQLQSSSFFLIPRHYLVFTKFYVYR